jgi:phage antirepressor YoqD-like protein
VLIGEYKVDAILDYQGKGWVAVKRMCEVLGIDGEGQRQRLDRASWACACMIKAHDNIGRLQEMYCLSVDSVPMWLATIDTKRCPEEVRPKLEHFQKEAAKTLSYWVQGKLKLDLKSRIGTPELVIELSTQLIAYANELLTERAANKVLTEHNEILKPKAQFYDIVADSKSALSMQIVASVLNIRGMGRNNLFKFLRTLKILNNNNNPYRPHIDAGRFRVVERSFERRGEICVAPTTLVLQKGIKYILEHLKKAGYINDAEMEQAMERAIKAGAANS